MRPPKEQEVLGEERCTNMKIDSAEEKQEDVQGQAHEVVDGTCSTRSKSKRCGRQSWQRQQVFLANEWTVCRTLATAWTHSGDILVARQAGEGIQTAWCVGSCCRAVEQEVGRRCGDSGTWAISLSLRCFRRWCQPGTHDGGWRSHRGAVWCSRDGGEKITQKVVCRMMMLEPLEAMYRDRARRTNHDTSIGSWKQTDRHSAGQPAASQTVSVSQTAGLGRWLEVDRVDVDTLIMEQVESPRCWQAC